VRQAGAEVMERVLAGSFSPLSEQQQQTFERLLRKLLTQPDVA
jgi:hypothetical protein